MYRYPQDFLTGALLMLLLTSCFSRKSETEASICNSETGLTAEQERYGFSIDYYGDYWFHRFNQKNTLNWHKKFIQTIALDGARGELVYCAHTMTEPYCTTTAFLYKNSKPATISGALLANLKKVKAVNKTAEEVFLGYNSFTKMCYELNDENMNINLKHLEYICDAGPHTLRISFWTTEANGEWLDVESKGIVQSLKTPL